MSEASQLVATVPQTVYVGRQPIFDALLEVVGYELLYRDSEQNAARFQDADDATTQVLLNTFIEIGLKRVIGFHRAFINVTSSFVLDGHFEDLTRGTH